MLLVARSRTSCCIYGFLKTATWIENYCITLKRSLETCSSRHKAARRENRHEDPLLGLSGRWRFYEKAVGAVFLNVRFFLFRIVTFDT
jgi:hypothetical protein